MTADLPERLARRSTVRRAVGLTAISAVIVLSVVGRSMTEPAPRSALGVAGLAQPIGPTGAAAVPGSSAAAPTLSHAPTKPVKNKHRLPATHRRTPVTTPAHTPAKPAAPTKPATRAPTTAPTTTAAPTVTEHTVTGTGYDVGYGTVQVRVTFKGSRIVDVTAVSLPQGGRSSDVSAMAAPQLRQEALAAQSANINTVSGASYTSAGYAKSLQSAIDRMAGG